MGVKEMDPAHEWGIPGHVRVEPAQGAVAHHSRRPLALGLVWVRADLVVIDVESTVESVAGVEHHRRHERRRPVTAPFMDIGEGCQRRGK